MPTFKEDSNNNIFGFGKQYKNFKIEDVPDDYLEWVIENCANIDDYLRNRIKDELMRRTRLGINVSRDDVGFKKYRWYKENSDWDGQDGLPF